MNCFDGSLLFVAIWYSIATLDVARQDTLPEDAFYVGESAPSGYTGHKPGVSGKPLRVVERRYVVDFRIDQPG
jgi:hypothetical protein